MSLRVLIAPDKFKGSLTSAEAAAAIERGVHRAAPDAQTTTVPMADGGEGTLDALLAAGGLGHTTIVRGPLMTAVEADWVAHDGRGYVEAAQANGLGLVRPTPHTAGTACTCGVGDLIRAALDAGQRDIAVTVGGSASTDGGAGLLRALGARITTVDGQPVGCGGVALQSATHLDLAGLDPRLRTIGLTAAFDVDSPLLGPAGAAAVFGPQKGADPATVLALEAGLRTWCRLLEAATGQVVDGPGVGAAGGTVAALLALGAATTSGADLVIDAVRLVPRSAESDLLITGEGSFDEQSARGKAVVAIAARARCPVAVVAGRVTLGRAARAELGVADAVALLDLAPSAEAAMSEAARWVSAAAAELVARYLSRR